MFNQSKDKGMSMIMMDVLYRIGTALKNFKPEIVDFADYEEFGDGKKMIVLLIVADSFDNIRSMTRCRMVNDTLAFKEPELAGEYTFAYECFTKKEYRMVRLCKKSLH